MNNALAQHTTQKIEGDFTLYPNPNNGMLFLNSTVNFEEASLLIFGINGVKVFETKITPQTSRINLSSGNNKIDNGIYMVRITTESGDVFLKKLIIN
jgi:hypothetical protein